MKTILKIARLELYALFYSPIAWLLAVILLFQCGFAYISIIEQIMTTQNIGGFALKYLSNLTQKTLSLPMGLMARMVGSVYLYLPLLTMGLISREVSSGTIKLLYSSPVKVREIVAGKFVAMMIYNLVLVGCMGIFMVAGLFNIEHAEPGIMFSSLLGMYLLVCAYAAIGLFMSSLTSYQVVAAICTFVVFAILGYLKVLWQGVDFVRELTYFLAIGGRAERMLAGLIRTVDIIYFLLIMGMFLSFTVIKLQSERVSRARLKVTGRYLGVLALVLFIGYFSSRPGWVGYWDTTRDKRLTLAAASQNIIRAFGKEELEITSYINLLHDFNMGSPEQRKADFERWESYIRYKPDIKLDYVYYYNATGNELKQYLKYEPGKTLQQIAGKRAKIYKTDIDLFLSPEEVRKQVDLSTEDFRYVMQLKYKGKTTFLRTFNDNQFWPSEVETDAALKRLLQAKLPKVAFLDGQFERSKDKLGDRDYQVFTSEKSFRYALVNQGFDAEAISLDSSDVPGDIAALVIADPRADFTPAVLARLQEYIDKGGNLFVLGEPGKQSVLNPLLQPLGVQLMDGELVQKDERTQADLVKPYFTRESAGFNKRFMSAYTDSIVVTMNGAAGLSYSPAGAYTVTPLLATDVRYAWNKKGKLVADSAEVMFNAAEGDTAGSFPTALALTRKVNGREQRIVVAGDADFLSNAGLRRPGGANFSFTVAVFSWFTQGEFPVNAVRPKSQDNLLNLTDEGVSRLKILFMGILPGLVIVAGTILLVRRRRK